MGAYLVSHGASKGIRAVVYLMSLYVVMITWHAMQVAYEKKASKKRMLCARCGLADSLDTNCLCPTCSGKSIYTTIPANPSLHVLVSVEMPQRSYKDLVAILEWYDGYRESNGLCDKPDNPGVMERLDAVFHFRKP